MDDAEEYIARLMVLFFEIALKDAINRVAGALEVRARCPGRLIDGEAMVIFVQDFR
jgi:hypothetical protein